MRANRLGGLIGVVVLATLFSFNACGGDDDGDDNGGSGGTAGDASIDQTGGTAGGAATGGTAGGGGTGGEDVKPACFHEGTACAQDGDCCSASCVNNACAPSQGGCKAAGQACTTGLDCCTLVCENGACGASICTSDNQPCTTDAQCCGGKCGAAEGGMTCTPINTTCKSMGNECTTNGECCSNVCTDGHCQGQVSFCTQTGDACTQDSACCTGICSKASGATIGTCKQASAPGTTGCLVAGEVCGAGAVDGGTFSDAGVPACGGECCSRSCAPYGPTGVFVCQPPSGCRPTGEACASDADCCGSPGMPGGNGSVKCSKSAGEPVGRCDNGGSCRPAGAICKLATTSCNAENNCCAGNVNTDPTVCQQDSLGIPRCTGVGDCKEAGSTAGKPCATSADCCGLPCLPNANPGDGGAGFICGSSCVPSGGACTTDADCCAGLPCKAPPGSTQGICGYTDIPDGGIPDTGIPDTGTDSGPTCAFYGQSCTTGADCCNNVPCTNGKCVYPVQ